jgi:hypothetical protein
LRQKLGQPDISSGVRAAVYLLALVADGGTLQVSQLPVLERLLDDICSDYISGITSADMKAVLELSETCQPWWQSVYHRPISTLDLIAAGLS